MACWLKQTAILLIEKQVNYSIMIDVLLFFLTGIVNKRRIHAIRILGGFQFGMEN